jgi:hypothetical protein
MHLGWQTVEQQSYPALAIASAVICHNMKFTIEKMCKVFKISKSGYYAWLKSGPSKRWQENEDLLIWIKNIYEGSRRAYGSP